MVVGRGAVVRGTHGPCRGGVSFGPLGVAAGLSECHLNGGFSQPPRSAMPRDRITLVPSERRVRVVAGEATVADSTGTLLLLETGHRPVYYFPRDDVRMDVLSPTNHRTTCPYKGDASYFSLKVDGHTVENAVWSYEQ